MIKLTTTIPTPGSMAGGEPDKRIEVKCGNCKHWQSSSFNGGICLKINFDITYPIAILKVAPGVRINTNSDFGCALFESKDEEKRDLIAGALDQYPPLDDEMKL